MARSFSRCATVVAVGGIVCVGKKLRDVSEAPRVRHTFASWTEHVIEQMAPSQAFRGVWVLAVATRVSYARCLIHPTFSQSTML